MNYFSWKATRVANSAILDTNVLKGSDKSSDVLGSTIVPEVSLEIKIAKLELDDLMDVVGIEDFSSNINFEKFQIDQNNMAQLELRPLSPLLWNPQSLSNILDISDLPPPPPPPKQGTVLNPISVDDPLENLSIIPPPPPPPPPPKTKPVNLHIDKTSFLSEIVTPSPTPNSSQQTH